VGYEDGGNALEMYAARLLQFKQQCKTENIDIPFVWHAGETLDVGGGADMNIVDALSLGTRRIGHGLSLIHHPHLMDIVKHQNIAIELCPISNKVLKYVPSDIRLHPLNAFVAHGLPVVLSPDDPAIFCVGEHPFSYDLWVAFMTWNMDVATLKMLAINSIEHALLDESEKSRALRIWEKQWKQWVNDMLDMEL